MTSLSYKEIVNKLARAAAAEASLAAANAEIERLREERAAVCKELGCVAKPGVALTFVKALRKEARRQYAQNVEIMRSWDAASPTELQELDRLRRGWGPSTPTERQARHADLLACVQAFSIALTDLALPEEIEVTEEAQKAFDAAYDRVYAGYITVLEVSQKMNEPIAKPDIDWEARAITAESSVATLTARVAELEAGLRAVRPIVAGLIEAEYNIETWRLRQRLAEIDALIQKDKNHG
jgi:hypothetical protein